MKSHLNVPSVAIQNLCRRHHIKRLSLFGSVLRDDFGPESDIDVLVEFEAGTRVTFLHMVDIQDELTALFGRGVDLLTPGALSVHFRDRVLASAEVVYEH